MDQFLLFAIVGFGAQLIDASLGMGFGVIASSLLLASGVPPPLISTAVNAAKIPTGLAATLSHRHFGNIDRRILLPVALSGIAGGILGALVLSVLDGPATVILVSVCLVVLGLLVIWRSLSKRAPRALARVPVGVIGATGGVIEGIGGSWGPVVTTGLVATGVAPRSAIGSSVAAEFAVSVMVFTTLMLTLAGGMWDAGRDMSQTLLSLAGLVAGGLPAALVAGWITMRVPRDLVGAGVGALAVAIGLWRLFGLA